MKGYTLVELLLTITVAAIFLAVAVPSYYFFIQNNRVISITNELSSSLSLARMEAIKRGVKVSVCSAANSSLSSCGNSGQWGQGWIVFKDGDEDNVIDSSEDVIHTHEALPNGVSIATNQALISYDSRGFILSGAALLTVNASGCTVDSARMINLSTSGRLSIARIACS